MKRSEMNRCISRALEYFDKAHIVLTEEEKARIEVADFDLGIVENVGLQLLVYVNTMRVCAKEMVLFPGQSCPEHWHVPTDGLPGPGEVRDAFSPQFPFIIESFGATVTSAVRLQDSAPDFRHWLGHTAADILMLTGGSSTSDVDWVRRTLAELGATYIFESVAIRPGHPALAALLPDGRLVLGLPGNPLAAHVALYSYLPAVLAGIFGQPLAQLPTGTLTAAVPGYSTKDLRLIPVTIEVTPGNKTY